MTITSSGLGALLDALHKASNLKYLSLPNAGLDDYGVLSLCDLINANKSIQKINNGSYSSTSGISKKALWALAEALVGNVILTELSLNVKVENGESCFDAFKNIATKTYIKEMHISRESVSDSEMTELKHLIKVPVEKREIPVTSTTKSAAKSNRR